MFVSLACLSHSHWRDPITIPSDYQGMLSTFMKVTSKVVWQRGHPYSVRINSLRLQEDSKGLHVSIKIIRIPILPYLESFNISVQVLKKLQRDYHQVTTFLLAWASNWVSDTFLELQWMHGTHISYILNNYHNYDYWYVTTVSLKIISYVYLNICHILGFEHVIYYCMQTILYAIHT